VSANGRYRLPTPRTAPLHVVAAYAGAERRSADPVAELSRDLDDLCLGAASALEVAVTLELLGYTTAYVRRAFGSDDVFDLADHLYDVTAAARAKSARRTAPTLTVRVARALSALWRGRPRWPDVRAAG
jgi:hypothetical protein